MKYSKTDCPPVKVEMTHSLMAELTVAASNDGHWGGVKANCLDLFIPVLKNTPTCTESEY